MATIREIAEYTKLSASTVSIVLSGKAADRNISEKTTKKILDAAKVLGYTPNISARRLRNNNTKKYISVFWANDYRAPLLFEFIHGMQQLIEETQSDIEIVLRLFTPDCLSASVQQEHLSMYSATVVCTASPKDLDYLERTDFSTPIVLYNRFSQKYSHAIVENQEIGAKAAEIFAAHGRKNAIVFATKTGHYIYSEKRMLGFMNTFSNYGGITTVINTQENSLTSSFETVKEAKNLFQHADCVFCLHDRLAISYLNFIRNTNLIAVPEDQEIISIGVHDNDTYDNLFIPLSVIEVPIREMGYECMRIVTDRLNGDNFEIESKVVNFTYVPRRTCL